MIVADTIQLDKSGIEIDCKIEGKIELVQDLKEIRPLTITENGVYEGGIEDGKQICYSPINVDIPKPAIKPLTIAENGTYAAEDCDGYSPVEVNVAKDTTATKEDIAEGKTAYIDGKKVEGTLKYKPKALKELVDLRGSANFLFANFARYQDEALAEMLSFDVTENATDFTDMFNNSQVATIPLFDIRKSTSLRTIFRLAIRLVNAPILETKHIQNFSYAFNQCTFIEVIPAWDVRNGTDFTGLCNSCSNLTEIGFKNIRANIQVASGTSWGHKLTLESLLHLIRELRDTGSPLTLIIGSANLAKLANIYVRPIEITDEMRTNDDLIDEKLPFELCESTDEGAVLIRDYVYYKNWQLG